MAKCPVIGCGNPMDPQDVSTYALSRRDGKTKICSSCGLGEAMDNFKKALKRRS